MYWWCLSKIWWSVYNSILLSLSINPAFKEFSILTRLTKETQIHKANLIQNITHSVSSFKENLILRIRKNIVEKYSRELKSIENFAFYSSFILKLPRIFFYQYKDIESPPIPYLEYLSYNRPISVFTSLGFAASVVK